METITASHPATEQSDRRAIRQAIARSFEQCTVQPVSVHDLSAALAYLDGRADTARVDTTAYGATSHPDDDWCIVLSQL